MVKCGRKKKLGKRRDYGNAIHPPKLGFNYSQIPKYISITREIHRKAVNVNLSPSQADIEISATSLKQQRAAMVSIGSNLEVSSFATRKHVIQCLGTNADPKCGFRTLYLVILLWNDGCWFIVGVILLWNDGCWFSSERYNKHG